LNADKYGLENSASFSVSYKRFGEKKKYKAHILKYVPCILNYL